MTCGREQCCAANCFGKFFGFFKDDKFDKETALAVLKTTFDGDQDWIKVNFDIV